VCRTQLECLQNVIILVECSAELILKFRYQDFLTSKLKLIEAKNLGTAQVGIVCMNLQNKSITNYLSSFYS